MADSYTIKLSIIIVNYKTSDLIIDCIESVKKYNTQLTIEMIVVDNDSKDSSKQRVLGAFKDVRWIDMGYNAGFARANNAGIKETSGKECVCKKI